MRLLFFIHLHPLRFFRLSIPALTIPFAPAHGV
jgi:hypothetical protein